MTIQPWGRYFVVCNGPKIVCLTWRGEFAKQAVCMLSLSSNKNTNEEGTHDEIRPDPTIA